MEERFDSERLYKYINGVLVLEQVSVQRHSYMKDCTDLKVQWLVLCD